MVLMLEPLYTCNLACLGCSTERHTGRLEDRSSLGKCFEAVEQSGAPLFLSVGESQQSIPS